MKRLILTVAAAAALAVGGCHHRLQNQCNGCSSCGGAQAQHIPHVPRQQMLSQQVGPAGPPSAAYAYPYYTTRGPRDFLMANPPSIGR